MTDYPNKRANWRRRQVADRWRSIVSIFITLVLVLAVFNGLVKISVKDYFGGGTRVGDVLVAAVNSTPGSLLILQDDPARLVLVRFDDSVYFATGEVGNPTRALREIFNIDDGNRMRLAVSKIAKVPILHFLKVNVRDEFSSDEHFVKFFKQLASISTPVSILAGGKLTEVAETNLTRIDLLSLWWQAKSLSINDLVFIDLSQTTSEIVLANGEKVLGVDSFGVARRLAEFIENREILAQQSSVSVKNASGVAGAGQLVSDLMLPVGVKVVRVQTADTQQEESQIVVRSGESYTARYLAKILGCDIKTQSNVAEDEIIVVVGRDFARKYQL